MNLTLRGSRGEHLGRPIGEPTSSTRTMHMPQVNDDEPTRRGPSGPLAAIVVSVLRTSVGVALSCSLVRPALASEEDVPKDMESAIVTLAAAKRRLAEDPRRAIALYEEGLAQIPEDPGYAPIRSEVLLTIVDAHGAAFAEDGDVERLYQARDLLDRYLGPLDLLDEQGRAAAEEQRAGLLDRIDEVEARMRVEARVREAAAARDRGRRLTTAGSAVLAGGVVSFGVMALGIRGGVQAEDELAALIKENGWGEPCSVGDEACGEERRPGLQEFIDRGDANNAMVLGGALVGGALLSTGIALLVLGRRSVRRAAAIDLTPTPAGAGLSLGIALRGRF